MKRILTFIIAVSVLLTVFLCGCGSNGATSSTGDIVEKGVTVKTKLQQLANTATDGIIADSMGKKTFASGNNHITVWGVENDQWQTMNLSRSKFDEYVAASLNVNANAIAVHMPWGVLEQSEGVYATGETSYLKYCVNKAREAGLKIVVYFTSTNYASGDGTFLPNYIVNDKEKYTRLNIPDVYDGNSQTDKALITMCINDEDLKAREILAQKKLMEFIKDNNDDGIFVAINIGSEIDYTHNWGSGLSINQEVRCHCDTCNALYQTGEGNESETPFKFMQRTYNNYLKTMVDVACETYSDIAVYSPVAALTWFAGGRYVEQPADIKALINRDNFFVCPSIAPTQNYAVYEAEMEYFTAIPGNSAFASGIDTGWTGSPYNNQAHLELAPWYSILEYGGLGAIYWDYPQSVDANSSILTQSAAITSRLKVGWAPLKATEYYISRFKGDSEVLNWWSYEEHIKQFNLGGFSVKINRSESDYDEHSNYGIALLMDDRDLVLAPTAYECEIGENNDITVTLAGTADGYIFEKGYFDGDGKWVKKGNFTPTVNGKTVVISVESGNGNYQKSCYRIYKNI